MANTEPTLPTVLARAEAAGDGVGAFNVVLLEHAEAIVAGAERADAPVILQISENCAKYHGSLSPIVSACQALARSAEVPVLVHLDHIEEAALIHAGIELGVDSVMYDGSRLPYGDNVAATADFAALCHASGISIEAELGEVGGKGGVHDFGVRTDPDEAAAFVAATGVDALAVAVGTSHAMTTRDAEIDGPLVGRLRAAVPVPLVLHGSSGLSDEQLREGVRAGVAKVNISTHINGVFTRVLRQELDAQPGAVDPRRYVSSAREALAEEVARLLAVLRVGSR